MTCRGLGKTLLLLAALLSPIWVVPSAALDTNVRIVRVSFVSGDVQLDRREGQGYTAAILNMPLTQGSRLWARGQDALAEIEFEDGSTLRLTPGANVELQDLSLRDSGEKVTSVDLQGTAYFDIRGEMGDFRVTSGGQQISVARPARFRVFGENGQFKVAVYRGSVDVRNGESQIAVGSGQTFTLDPTDPEHYSLAKSIAEGSYDDWNQERERYTQSYSSASTYSADSNYAEFSPAYSYGLADLAYYGNYFYAPGWGWMWRPYYMGAAWNPFMDGSWVWYPQFGYAWVSPYPWGWMPYRYGNWNLVPGYGWAWMPATTWTTWAPVTGVNHPPVGWVPIHPPAPPQPGAPSIVSVGNGWKAPYQLGPTHPVISRASLLSSEGQSTAGGTTVYRGWNATSAWAPNNGIVSNGGTPLRPLIPSAAAVPHATTPAASGPSRHPKLPPTAGRTASVPRPGPVAAGPHAWGGGGHAGGGGGGHASAGVGHR